MDHVEPRRRLVLPVQWLFSARGDLSWLLGSVLVAYAMFALWRTGVCRAETVILIWVFAFHGPHFFSTLSRTYADKAQYRARRRLYNRSLLWFLVGPLFIGIGLLVHQLTGRDDVIKLFFFLAAVWAFHHVAKQHFGFLALYRARHREFNRRDFLFHKYYLLISLWMPALILLSNNYDWLANIPGRDYLTIPTLLTTAALLRTIFTWTFWLTQLVFVGSLVWRIVRGRGINLPIVLLILCCVPLHWYVITTCMSVSLAAGGRPLDSYVLVPVLTTYHNLQYLGICWHYNRVKYRDPNLAESERKEFGVAPVLSSNIARFLTLGVIFTAATIGFEHYGIPAISGTGPVPLLFKGFFWGFAFHHYYMDSKIWHASEDADLRRVLGFQRPRLDVPATASGSTGPVVAATPAIRVSEAT